MVRLGVEDLPANTSEPVWAAQLWNRPNEVGGSRNGWQASLADVRRRTSFDRIHGRIGLHNDSGARASAASESRDTSSNEGCFRTNSPGCAPPAFEGARGDCVLVDPPFVGLQPALDYRSKQLRLSKVVTTHSPRGDRRLLKELLPKGVLSSLVLRQHHEADDTLCRVMCLSAN